MTETEWLTSLDYRAMLWHRNEWRADPDSWRRLTVPPERRPRYPVSDRKLRLFAVACCRHFWGRVRNGSCRRGAETAEKYADARCSRQALTDAGLAAYRDNSGQFSPFDDAAWETTLIDAFDAAGATVSCLEQHVDIKSALSPILCALLHDVLGNPFRLVAVAPVWLARNGGAVVKVAQGIYQDRAFDQMPILADALEDAGCTDTGILAHCRGNGEHARGCWVVDLLLGKS